jgi:anti-anti-sigma factor
VQRESVSPLEVTESTDSATPRLSLSGELDVLTAPRFLRVLETAMARVMQGIEVDASGLSFVDSAGLRALVTGWQRAMQLGLEVTIVDPSPELLRILEVTGLTHLLGDRT